MYDMQPKKKQTAHTKSNKKKRKKQSNKIEGKNNDQTQYWSERIHWKCMGSWIKSKSLNNRYNKNIYNKSKRL